MSMKRCVLLPMEMQAVIGLALNITLQILIKYVRGTSSLLQPGLDRDRDKIAGI
jgi:hypothetical protein